MTTKRRWNLEALESRVNPVSLVVTTVDGSWRVSHAGTVTYIDFNDNTVTDTFDAEQLPASGPGEYNSSTLETHPSGWDIENANHYMGFTWSSVQGPTVGDRSTFFNFDGWAETFSNSMAAPPVIARTSSFEATYQAEGTLTVVADEGDAPNARAILRVTQWDWDMAFVGTGTANYNVGSLTGPGQVVVTVGDVIPFSYSGSANVQNMSLDSVISRAALSFTVNCEPPSDDLTAVSVAVDGSSISYSYYNQTLLPSVPLKLYWSSNFNTSGIIGGAAYTTALSGADATVGTHTKTISRSELTTRPDEAVALLLVLDPDDTVVEMYENNNVTPGMLSTPLSVSLNTANRDDWAGANNFGTYISGISLGSTFGFQAYSAIATKVKFQVGSGKVVTRTIEEDFLFDPGTLKGSDTPYTLTVKAYDQNNNLVHEPYIGYIKVIDKLAADLEAAVTATETVDIDELRLLAGVNVSAPFHFKATIEDLPLANFYRDKLAIYFENQQTKKVYRVATPFEAVGGGTYVATFIDNPKNARNDDQADYQLYIAGAAPMGKKNPPKLSTPENLFVAKLPTWMGESVTADYGQLPTDLFTSASGYRLTINLVPGKLQSVGLTKNLPYKEFNKLDSQLNIGVIVKVYAKLTTDEDDVKLVTDKAYINATILGMPVLSQQQLLQGHDFDAEFALQPRSLELASLLVKTKNPLSLLSNPLPLADKSFGPWKLGMRLLNLPQPLPDLSLEASVQGAFKATLTSITADAQIKWKIEKGQMTIEKEQSFLGVKANIDGLASLTAGLGLSFNVLNTGVDLIKIEGTALVKFNVTGQLAVNFDTKSVSINNDKTGLWLTHSHSVTPKLILVNQPVYSPKPEFSPPKVIPIFGTVAATAGTTNSGTGIQSQAPVISTLTRDEPLYADAQRIQATVLARANTLTPTLGQHRLQVVLQNDSTEVVLTEYDLGEMSFVASSHPLGFETAPWALDLELPESLFENLEQYHLRFRLESEPGSGAEEAQILVTDLTVLKRRPAITLDTPHGDLSDDVIEFGTETAGFAEAIINIRNTGSAILTIDKTQLVGKGYEIINVPGSVFSIAPTESYPLHVRLLNAAVRSEAMLRFTAPATATPLREVLLRYTPSAVAQQVSFAAPYVLVAEQSAGRLKVVLAQPAQETVTVAYAVTGGTAVAGADFAAFGGTLTFRKGQRVQYIKVPTLNNSDHQPYRTLHVTLSNPTGAALGAIPTTIYTIRDDDPRISFGSATAEGIEPSRLTKFALPVYLSEASTTRVIVKYQITGGSATLNKDYVLKTGTLVFAPGQTRKDIMLSLLPDQQVEADETITLTLFAPKGGVLGEATTLTFTLHDFV